MIREEKGTLFWNVHRRRKKDIRSIFGFESDPSERVYPVRPRSIQIVARSGDSISALPSLLVIRYRTWAPVLVVCR